MPTFGKRNRLSRFSPDRSKPPREEPGITVAPRGKGAGRFLFTLVFLIGGIAVLNFPTLGPQLRVGQVARRDYRARTSFQVVDREATRRAREIAAGRATRVFRENADHVSRIPRRFQSFLQRVLAARDLQALEQEAREEWGLTRGQLDELQGLLKPQWIGPGVDAVETAMRKAVGRGIISASDYELEDRSERYEIAVQGWDPEEPVERRSLVRLIPYPGGLRSELEQDLMVWLNDKPARLERIVLDMLVFAAKPTLRLDEAATAREMEKARNDVMERRRAITEGSLLLAAGDRATEQAIEEIALEEREFKELGSMAKEKAAEREDVKRRLFGSAGRTAVFLLGFALLAAYGLWFAGDVLESNTRVFGIYTVCLIVLLAMRLLEPLGPWVYLTPVILAAMVLVIAAGPTLAFGAATFLALLCGIATNGGLVVTLPLLAGGAVAILELTHIRRQTDPLEAGAVAGVACAAAIWAIHLSRIPYMSGNAPWPVLDAGIGLGGAVMGGILLSAGLPYIERFFNVATEVRLLEWTDQNQPLLRKLALEAPGTYHHSTVVSHMAAAAAKAIGANAVLARAGAYLHDVGKLNRPEYFIENAVGRPSPHEHLSCMMSTLILTAHPKDGVEIADQYGVPAPLQRIIAEHHGTTLAQYFYDKAKTEADVSGRDVNMDNFRYRGPLPRTPESVIVMLADAAESAARSLKGASPGQIERLVKGIVESRMKDGQFDESRMNITDIRRVEASLIRSLLAVSHPRIQYANT